MAVKLSTAIRTAMMAALNTALGASAPIRLYDGARPATADTAIGTQNKALEWTGNAGGFGAAAAGSLTASAVAAANGVFATTVTWGRVVGATGNLDFSVGLSGSGADMIMSNTNVAVSQSEAFTSFVYTEANS